MTFLKSTKQPTANTLQINWKEFYRQVFALVLPMALQNLINVGVTAADVIMLGKVGEKVLSGASLAGQIQFIMMLVFFGLTSGATVLTAQYWGKGDTKTIEKVLGMGLSLGILVAAVFAVAAIAIPSLLMQIFTNDPDVIAEGVKYLQIIGISYLLMAVTQVYLNIVRSIERVVIATVVFSISLLVNVFLNWILIFGHFGMPAMGTRGAALATLLARAVEVAIVIWYATVKNKVVRIRIKYMFHFDKWLIKDYLKFSAPVIINEMLWGLGMSTYAAILGHLGSAAIAANSVTQVGRQLSMVVVFGIAQATAIYLGRTIGEQKIEHAKAYANKFLKISIVAGFIGAGVILLAAPIANANLALTDQAKNYLSWMFLAMALNGIGQSFNATLIVGTFRAGGDTKVGLYMDVGTMWGGSIIMGALAAFVFHAPVPVVYFFLTSDELLKLPFTISRFRSYKWLKNVTRDVED